MEGNDLELTSGQREIAVARDPNVVLTEAKNAAKALMSVVSQKKKPVIMNGEQYLEFEDWQTVGRFYGLTVKVIRSTFLDYGQVKGWEASADVIRLSDGMAISSADAMCLNDEDKWSTRAKYEYIKGVKTKTGEIPVPLFQLRSMAQTRACAKALRNVLAWVVVLGGFKPTPAEEMTDGIAQPAPTAQKPAVSMPQAKEPKPTPAPEQAVDTSTEAVDPAALGVVQALKQPDKAKFNTWGILFSYKVRSVKTKKGQMDITDYKLNQDGGNEQMEISKFGKPPEGLANDDVVTFTDVVVSTYNGELKYLAQEVAIIEKAEDKNDTRD
jgi:hypothetical protein